MWICIFGNATRTVYISVSAPSVVAMLLRLSEVLKPNTLCLLWLHRSIRLHFSEVFRQNLMHICFLKTFRILTRIFKGVENLFSQAALSDVVLTE